MRDLAPAVVALLGFLSQPAHAFDFAAEVRERLPAYEDVRTDPAGVRAALLGRYESYHQKLEAVVPDSQKTAADHFVLGNMLYDVAPDRSLSHHRAALSMLPDEPMVWIEMAYQHHRRGECEKALPFYERVAAEGRLHPPQQALLAHCLVRAGRYREAVEAWIATEHARRHTAVDFTIHDVFGELSPLARHDRLIKRVRAGERAAVGELFENALAWRRDWWNGGRNQKALDAAMDAVEQSFGGNAVAVREIRVWRASLDTDTPEELAALLDKEGLIVNEGSLPESSFVARKLLTDVARRGLTTVSELAQRFTQEVERRARGPEPDPDALFLLGAFVAESGTSGALQEVDRYGWKRYQDADFAFSLILARRKALGEGFTDDDLLLREALADFPDDPRFALLAVTTATRAGRDTPDHLARLIQAEYHGLRSDDSRYSYALERYYAELARNLLPSAPAAPAD